MDIQKPIIATTATTTIEKAKNLIQLEKIYKDVKERIDAYRAELLEETKKMDVLSLKTGSYTISRVKKLYPKVTDVQALKKALDKEKIPYEMQEVFADYMKNTFKQLAEEQKQLDGLNIDEIEYIMVRINNEEL